MGIKSEFDMQSKLFQSLAVFIFLMALTTKISIASENEVPSSGPAVNTGIEENREISSEDEDLEPAYYPNPVPSEDEDYSAAGEPVTSEEEE